MITSDVSMMNSKVSQVSFDFPIQFNNASQSSKDHNSYIESNTITIQDITWYVRLYINGYDDGNEDDGYNNNVNCSTVCIYASKSLHETTNYIIKLISNKNNYHIRDTILSDAVHPVPIMKNNQCLGMKLKNCIDRTSLLNTTYYLSNDVITMNVNIRFSSIDTNKYFFITNKDHQTFNHKISYDIYQDMAKILFDESTSDFLIKVIYDPSSATTSTIVDADADTAVGNDTTSNGDDDINQAVSSSHDQSSSSCTRSSRKRPLNSLSVNSNESSNNNVISSNYNGSSSSSRRSSSSSSSRRGKNSRANTNDNSSCDIPVHKVILQSRSNVFRSMFSMNMIETTSHEITITDFTYDVVKEFIKFLYLDKCNQQILKKYSLSLLSIAHKYSVQGLFELCENY